MWSILTTANVTIRLLNEELRYSNFTCEDEDIFKRVKTFEVVNKH